MITKRGGKFGLSGALFCGLVLGVFAEPKPHEEADGTVVKTIKVENVFDSEIYGWPETLLSYPVKFSAAEKNLDSYELLDRDTSVAQPVQWSAILRNDDGTLKSATLHLMSSLPKGERRHFDLVRKRGARAYHTASVRVSESSDYFEMRSDRLAVRVPRGRTLAAGHEIIGPMVAVERNGRWLGHSRLVGAKLEVDRLESRIVDRGPLFATAELIYLFKSGARYTVKIRVTANYDHFDFSEEMESLNENEGVAFEIAWDNFHARRRFAANGWEMPKGYLGISEAVVTDGIVEEPHWFPPETVEDPSKEMIYRLAFYQGNQPRNAVPVMSFWEQGADALEVSAFVGDTASWRDKGYGIWQPSDALNIRFRYKDEKLVWSFPLITGNRTTGIAVHEVKSGEAAVQRLRASYAKAAQGDARAFTGNVVYDVNKLQLRYGQLLRSWYGALSLDKQKDWVLEYPPAGRAPSALLARNPLEGDTPAKFEDDLFKSALLMYPLGLNLGVMNISHRVVGRFLERYASLREKFSVEQKRRIDGVLLLCAYVNASEELSPVRTTLAGAPNMAADGFSIPAEISAVFPDHPMGETWRDQFEKTVELNGVFYTRPAVAMWNAKGGRWAESLATYHWAQLLPITTAQLLAASVDGKNRLASSEFAERAEWLVGQLTAPIFNPNPEWRSGRAKKPSSLGKSWREGDSLAPEFGFERQLPAHGAHSSGTTTVLPDSVALMADSLKNYAPMAAEHLMWAHAQVRSSDKGEWLTTTLQREQLKQSPKNSGTPPMLESAKFTGHGIVLRAGVGTPEEVSVHLDQIDQGPNYRWGNSGEGNSGTLYYYAGGKVWTGHETENTGDHTTEDTLGTTTFGVWKNGAYRSIGANVLDRPLFNLGVAQWATLAARSSPRAYAWPQYRTRNVMLVGTDYFILMDEASGPSRFTWFNAADLDLPKLIFLDPATTRPDHWTEVKTRMAHGILRDVSRDTQSSVVLVTHKGEAVNLLNATVKPLAFPELFQATETKIGAPVFGGVYRIQAPRSRDFVFCSVERTAFAENEVIFEGTAGVVRLRDDGKTDIALFSGTKIGAKGWEIFLPEKNAAAISATFSEPGRIEGRYSAMAGATQLTIRGVSSAARCYVDGALVSSKITNGMLEMLLPQGEHAWELTEGLPVPVAPLILGTNNFPGGAEVAFSPVASADDFIFEISTDACATWWEAGQAKQSPWRIEGMPNGRKIHVRVRAANRDQQSKPSGPYPIYVSGEKPAAPEGLRAWLDADAVTLSWGEILGVAKYHLYRRELGKAPEWKLIYSGGDRKFTDHDHAGRLPAVIPGELKSGAAAEVIWEYAVSSANENGESRKSFSCNTDSSSWLNWWPQGTPRKAKRNTGYLFPPYLKPEEVGPDYYP